MSKSTVSRVSQAIKDEFDAFRQRDLGVEFEYPFLDGTHFKYHAVVDQVGGQGGQELTTVSAQADQREARRRSGNQTIFVRSRTRVSHPGPEISMSSQWVAACMTTLNPLNTFAILGHRADGKRTRGQARHSAQQTVHWAKGTGHVVVREPTMLTSMNPLATRNSQKLDA